MPELETDNTGPVSNPQRDEANVKQCVSEVFVAAAAGVSQVEEPCRSRIRATERPGLVHRSST